MPADIYLTAGLWIALALVASLISIRIGVSVALLEIGMGILGGNFLHLHVTLWINFLASFGSVLLTFLAGAEIDPQLMRARFKEAMGIGILSFLLPFLGHLRLRTSPWDGSFMPRRSAALLSPPPRSLWYMRSWSRPG
jgi:Kef-type K+ transport system membrane component KefB